MKKFILLALALASSVSHADVRIISPTLVGYISGVVVRSDLQEVKVVVACGPEKGSIYFTKNNFNEGLSLINSTGKYINVSMSREVNNVTIINEYSISNGQEFLPGGVICK